MNEYRTEEEREADRLFVALQPEKFSAAFEALELFFFFFCLRDHSETLVLVCLCNFQPHVKAGLQRTLAGFFLEQLG